MPDSGDAYRIVFETTPHGIVFHDARGAILAANPAAERILGVPLDQMKGRTSVDPRWQTIHEDGSAFPGESHPAMLAISTGLPTGTVVMGVRNPADACNRWIQVSATPLLRPGATQAHGAMATFVDITERKQAEDALRKSQARLHRAESVAHFGNWELELETGMMSASEGARTIYGMAGSRWPVADVKTVVLPEYRAGLDAALAGLIEDGRPYEVEFRIQRPADLEVRAIRSTAEFDPARRRVFGTIQDITDRVRADEERRLLHNQLLQAQKMESLGSLAGGVAHDMNNVLGAILGLASASLEAQPPGSAARQAFEIIIKAAERGGNMVKSLLSFARQTTAEERELDLNALLHEEVRLLERTTLAKVRIEIDFAPDLRPILGDATVLAHALMNLAVNAVDAMPDGGTFTLRTRNLAGGWIEVRVEDTGAGMTREVLERAMDPYYTTKSYGKGTGLGLSMVYSAVKAHRGLMEIRSEPGRGTGVRLRFPACEPGARVVAPEREAPSRAAKGRLEVLVIDDDELVQSSMAMLLQALGHGATIAGSGEEALERLESGLRPDVAILDMNMPGLGGGATLPLLRALRPLLPVLLATGRADQAALDLVEADAHTTLLSKPFTMDQLRTKLDAAL